MTHFCGCGAESKYCCPKCKERTCSLACVKRHKTAKNCDGVEDKTEFVKLSEFDTLQLISDYRFLEGLRDTTDSSQRDNSARQKKPVKAGIRRYCQEHNITLQIMPDTFTRHKENKTYTKEGVMYWTVELVFTELRSKIISHDVPDTDTVDMVIERYRSKSTAVEQYKTVTRYFKYKPTVNYLVKANVRKPNCYHAIGSGESLRECLRSKTIIEFPTIYLVQDVEEYTIVPCDDTCIAPPLPLVSGESGSKVNRKRTQRQRKREKIQRLKEQDAKRRKEEKEKGEKQAIVPAEVEKEGVEKEGVGKEGTEKKEDVAKEKEEEPKIDSFRQSVLALFG
eukprot:sb/3466525/